MKKKLVIGLCFGAIATLWQGCSNLTGPASEPSVNVDIQSIGTVALDGAAADVAGTITADSLLTGVSVAILDGAGNTKTGDFTITYAHTPSYAGKTAVNLAVDWGMSIRANEGIQPGTYVLDIIASRGTLSGEGKKSFSVVGTPATTVQVTLGSYANTSVPSSIDLDNGTLLLANDAKLNGSGVDLVVTYAGAPFNAVRVMSPDYAAANSGITAFAGWASPNVIFFNRANVNFDAITTKEQIRALFDSTQAAANNGALSCATGDVVVVQTDEGNYALVQVGAFDATTTGVVRIKYGS